MVSGEASRYSEVYIGENVCSIQNEPFSKERTNKVQHLNSEMQQRKCVVNCVKGSNHDMSDQF